jgi:hypothetical protein
MVGSIGLANWDLPTCLALSERIPMDLVLPVRRETVSDLCEYAETYIGCNLPADWRFFALSGVETTTIGKKLWPIRDAQVIRAADVLLAVAVSPGGTLERLVSEVEQERRVDESCRIDYARPSGRLAYRVAPAVINPDLRDFHREYLVHYTRAANGPWPDESVVAFWKSVTTSERYPRDALATLVHIAQTGRILGSGRHMPGHVPCVSFTALPVVEAMSLMRWRSRYHEMSLEPYGVAVARSVAEDLGIRPVVYYDGSRQRPRSDEQWQWQTIGRMTDWRAEQEWRARGDVLLGRVPASKVRLLCRTAGEAQLTHETTGYEAIPIQV